ncbi:hypothetical protein BGW80DRAFT_529227 [Lactifluus volemus]|nr:hypothetical protein BGW80DRAFT_529227 [Lactifluus volemus]
MSIPTTFLFVSRHSPLHRHAPRPLVPLHRNYLCLHMVQIFVYVATSVPQPAFPLPGERLFVRSHFLPFSHFPLSCVNVIVTRNSHLSLASLVAMVVRGIFMTLKNQSPERIESSNSGASAKAMIVSVLYSTSPLQLNAPLIFQPTTTGIHISDTC